MPIQRARARVVLLLTLGIGLAACGLARPGGPSINLSVTAGLSHTQSIEVVALPEPGQAGEQPERMLAVITDPGEIQRIVAALDTRLRLVPRALCLERYRLRFLQSDGAVVSFGYSCDGSQAFLRGDQSYWQGLEVVPPEAFQQFISATLQD